MKHWASERLLLTNGAFVLQLAFLEERDDSALAAGALIHVDLMTRGSTPSVGVGDRHHSGLRADQCLLQWRFGLSGWGQRGGGAAREQRAEGQC